MACGKLIQRLCAWVRNHITYPLHHKMNSSDAIVVHKFSNLQWFTMTSVQQVFIGKKLGVFFSMNLIFDKNKVDK